MLKVLVLSLGVWLSSSSHCQWSASKFLYSHNLGRWSVRLSDLTRNLQSLCHYSIPVHVGRSCWVCPSSRGVMVLKQAHSCFPSFFWDHHLWVCVWEVKGVSAPQGRKWEWDSQHTSVGPSQQDFVVCLCTPQFPFSFCYSTVYDKRVTAPVGIPSNTKRRDISYPLV